MKEDGDYDQSEQLCEWKYENERIFLKGSIMRPYNEKTINTSSFLK